ncbi:LysE family translocator [Psychromonas sp. RZ22]|nr:LysE family translocator [Psychromonas sp. RZ22]
MLSLYLTFAISITLLISSPGPIISLVISDSKHGWPTGTIWGGAISALLLLAISLVVIHFALVIDENILDWGRVIGGVYLAYLGLSILRSKVHIEKNKSHHKDCFWRTMKAGLSNPKDILFFLAFLPSFIVSGESFIEQSFIFLGIWAVIDMGIMVAYAGLAKKLFSYQKSQPILYYLPGIFMMLVGLISLYLGVVSLIA